MPAIPAFYGPKSALLYVYYNISYFVSTSDRLATSSLHTLPSNGVPTISRATASLLCVKEAPATHAARARLYSPAASTPHSAHVPPSLVARHFRT